MKRAEIVICIAAGLFALSLLGLPLGVWLPDVFIPIRHTLASATLTNGYSFRVIQYWNHVDFYSTELHIKSPDGRTDIRTLDGDDWKTWRVPMTLDEEQRVVSVTLGGNRLRMEKW
jgi:hypothetical protein